MAHACSWPAPGVHLLQEKRIWHSYVARSRTEHSWAWPADQKLQAFFLWSDWGVTAWLRLISRRLVCHFASFNSEAAVHKAEAAFFGDEDIIPPRAGGKLFKAWIVWRVARRIDQGRHSQRETCASHSSVNLKQDTEELLDGIWGWYPRHMFSNRVAFLPSLRN